MISTEDANELLTICNEITIPLLKYRYYGPSKHCAMGRAQKFGNHRSALLGYVYKRNQPRSNGRQLSAFSIKQSKLYDCLIKLAHKYFSDHKWTSIQLNHNVTCPPHKDKHNNGPSIIFAIGDYTGSELIIANDDGEVSHNIQNNIVSFDGSKYTHWNSPLLSGDKYSFVFYA
jgi:hypothetical protein